MGHCIRALVFAGLAAAFASGQNPNTAVFPSRTAADTDLFVASNNSSTTLNGSLTSSATSITLTSGTGFTAPVIVAIDTEIIHCTTLTTNTLSGCTRGSESTIGASHSSGATVTNIISAWHHNQIAAEVKAIEANVCIPVYTSVSYSATPTFTVTGCGENVFYLQLTGSVTSSTLSGGQAGQRVTFIICENSTAGYTYVAPTNTKEPQLIDSADPSVCNTQSGVFGPSATNLYFDGPGLVGQ